jgi:hypothetical protein
MTPGLLPLLLLWMWNKPGGGARASLTPPSWPTPMSPPPMPAFSPGASPATATDANTATPLASLQQVPESVHPTSAHPAAVPHHPRAAPRPSRPPSHAAHAAHAAATRRAASISPVAHPASGSTLRAVTVADLQAILINRGYRLKHDGLYGPKTRADWAALARKKGLPPHISRVDAKIARVAAQTFDALAVPKIP